MEENVQKELEAIRGKVLTWKRSYLGWATPDGENEFLAQEFSEEIDTYVFPYVRRLYQCNYLTPFEAKEFLDFCYGQVEDLRYKVTEAKIQE